MKKIVGLAVVFALFTAGALPRRKPISRSVPIILSTERAGLRDAPASEDEFDRQAQDVSEQIGVQESVSAPKTSEVRPAVADPKAIASVASGGSGPAQEILDLLHSKGLKDVRVTLDSVPSIPGQKPNVVNVGVTFGDDDEKSMAAKALEAARNAKTFPWFAQDMIYQVESLPEDYVQWRSGIPAPGQPVDPAEAHAALERMDGHPGDKMIDSYGRPGTGLAPPKGLLGFERLAVSIVLRPIIIPAGWTSTLYGRAGDMPDSEKYYVVWSKE